jgi:hypothetical protein
MTPRHRSIQAQRKPMRAASTAGSTGAGGRRQALRSTSTVARDGHVVPWLAAEGPLAYSPESPPERDYYFQYGWVLPGIFAEGVRRRRYPFGAGFGGDAGELQAFWESARRGELTRVSVVPGSLATNQVTAPLAVYRAPSARHGSILVLIQHGSYQLVREDDQPLVASGELMLYRGLQSSAEFRHFQPAELDDGALSSWRRFVRVQAHVLSDSVRSFNSIHDRACRCETEHILDRSRVTDDIARAHGLPIDGEGFARALWSATHQSFALERWVAEHKFGPNYVACKTSLGNVRITSFFAGEHEARIIDPRRLDVIESHGCGVIAMRCSRDAPPEDG